MSDATDRNGNLRNAHPFPLLRATPDQIAELHAFLKRPYPARGRPFGPGFDHFRQKAAHMQNPTIALVVSILTLAAQLGRALGPDAAAGFFDDLFAGRIGPEAAAEKAAAALSTALDVGILAAQLSALHGLILAADAEATVNKAVNFSQPPPNVATLNSGEAARFAELLAGSAPADTLPLTERAASQLRDMLAVITEPVADLPDGSVRVTREEFDRLMALIDEATKPSTAPVPLISAETDAGFARLEQEAQASEEGAADRG